MKNKPRPLQADNRVHGVIAAIRRNDGCWLMIRRSAHVPVPLKVCFPGGAMETRESQRDAIIREVREELGLVVRPLQCVWRWDSPTAPLTLWGWTAEIEGGQLSPNPDEIAEVLWLPAIEGSCHPDGLPTNPLFIAALPGSGDAQTIPA